MTDMAEQPTQNLESKCAELLEIIVETSDVMEKICGSMRLHDETGAATDDAIVERLAWQLGRCRDQALLVREQAKGLGHRLAG